MDCLQNSVALQHLKSKSQRLKSSAVIVAGDFNTETTHPGYRLLETGSLTPEVRDHVNRWLKRKKLKKVSDFSVRRGELKSGGRQRFGETTSMR